MGQAKRIARLPEIAAKEEKVILGLMSGTSLDGLDMALCRVRGHGPATVVELLHHATDPYSEEEQERLRELISQEEVPLKALCIAHAWLAERHARTVLKTLRGWKFPAKRVDCLASHGITAYHAPGSWERKGEPRHATLQIGDGDHLAVHTGILTLSDFRQKEIAGGGQGAPLAPYAEALLFGGAARPRILLNLGGIANFTWLPAQGEATPQGNATAPVYGDTGPANGLIDRAVRKYFPERKEGFDRDGRLAAAGTVHQGLLLALLAHPYFALACPKSTGPETFGEEYLEHVLTASGATGSSATVSADAGFGTAGTRTTEEAAPEDVVATLTRLTAATVAETLRRELPGLARTDIYLSGGGKRNPTLTAWLAEALPELEWHDSAELGIPPDAKEAVLFAVLANETLSGTGFRPPNAKRGATFGFGKISFPD